MLVKIELSAASTSAVQRAAFTDLFRQFTDAVCKVHKDDIDVKRHRCVRGEATHLEQVLTYACTEIVDSRHINWRILLRLVEVQICQDGSWRVESGHEEVSTITPLTSTVFLSDAVFSQVWESVRLELARALKVYGLLDKINPEQSYFTGFTDAQLTIFTPSS